MGSSRKLRYPASVKPGTSVGGELGGGGPRCDRDGHDAGSLVEEAFDGVGVGRIDGGAQREHRLGGPFDHLLAPVVVGLDQDGARTGVVVEGSKVEAGVATQVGVAERRIGEGLVKGILTDVGRSSGSEVGLAAEQSELGDGRFGVPVRRQRLDVRQSAVGQRSGLVGDQDVDVAEVLDADQALDQHMLFRQEPSPRSKAGVDDGREELGG